MSGEYPRVEEWAGLPVMVDPHVPPGTAYIVPIEPLTLPVRLAVGSYVYDLGEITGTTTPELSEALAGMAEELAEVLRGPEATPADPCEGCGAAMVHRRGHAGRYTIVSRHPDGRVAIYGVHHVGTCVMDREQREALAEGGFWEAHYAAAEAEREPE